MKFLKFISGSLRGFLLIALAPLIGMLIAHIMAGDASTAWVIFSILIPFILLFIVALIAAVIIVPLNAKIKKSAWGLLAIAKVTGNFVSILFGLFLMLGVAAIIHNYAARTHGGSRCFARGVDFVDLTVGHDKYHVPTHDIFMMPGCNLQTSSKSLTVDSFSVEATPYKVAIEFGNPGGPMSPSMEKSKAEFEAKFHDKFSALKGSPTNSMGLILHEGVYVGFKDDGRMVALGCSGDQYSGTCTGHIPGVNEYIFSSSELKDWKQIDDAVQAYVTRIRR